MCVVLNVPIDVRLIAKHGAAEEQRGPENPTGGILSRFPRASAVSPPSHDTGENVVPAERIAARGRRLADGTPARSTVFGLGRRGEPELSLKAGPESALRGDPNHSTLDRRAHQFGPALDAKFVHDAPPVGVDGMLA